MIEILVVVALLSVIVLGLMAMFNQTQRAFRLGMSQTDVLQSGRMATELITREIGQTTPSYLDWTNASPFDAFPHQTPNFDSQVMNFTLQSLPGSAAFRTNIMDDVFFLVRENQIWTGVGYFVRTNRIDDPELPGGVGPAGTLYRFETNDTVALFHANPGGLFDGFNLARSGDPLKTATNGVSKVVEGVVHFRIRPFDTSGWIIPRNPLYSNVYNLPAFASSNLLIDFNYQSYSGEYGLYSFYSNAVPAAVEMELGVLEQQVYDQYKSIPILSAQQKFLTNQAPHVHLFRQHIPIRTVDPTAYSTNAF
jgi:hypothetical protein